MADFEATGDELHKLVRLGKKRPMPFAFCPSSGEDDSLFATHRKKPPEMIAKSARKASGQTKVCFGTFTVEAKLMTLVLIKELPAIAKKLKKHLRRERLPLNVRIVDLMGNELESDIEELADDLLPDPDDADMQDEDASTETVAEDILDATDEDLPDPKDLARQLKGLQPDVMALQGDVGDKLRAALGATVGLLKAGHLLRAESTINAMARVVARQSLPAPNPNALVAAKRVNTLRAAVAQIGGIAGEKLTAALGLVAQQITAGETVKAGQTMDAVESAIARNTAAPNSAAPAPRSSDMDKWAALVTRLEPIVLAVLKGGDGDTDAIKHAFSTMQNKAAAGEHAAALAVAPQLAALVKTAQSQAKTADVTPLVASRLAWISTRAQLRLEMEKLKAAMDVALDELVGISETSGETGRLFDYLDLLDDRLETALETLTTTPDGPAREVWRLKARDILSEYKTALDSDFFRDVDGDNGFAPVKLRAPALAALQGVSSALAA